MDPKTGLYSRAAQLIRQYGNERGTAEQMIAFAKKSGLKQAELDHAQPPTGPTTREALAQHFERNLPRLQIDQYGENPRYNSNSAEPPNVLHSRNEDGDQEPEDPQYGGYTMNGGNNYRERLLKLGRPVGENRQVFQVHTGHPTEYNLGEFDTEEGAQRKKQEWLDRNEGYRAAVVRVKKPAAADYQSTHWAGHPNVLAHIRLQDRIVGEDRESLRPVAEKLAKHMGANVRDLGSGSADYGVKNGVITPQEAASLSRLMGWKNDYRDKQGIGKRLLHVEEMQSDWAQEGRDSGFYDPENPYEVFNTKTGETVSKHPTHSAAWDAFRAMPDEQSAGLDYGHAGKDKPPSAPYVQNTQHWTDLALKNVLREAALGNYDGIVFTPGQAQADRYGLEKQVDRLEYHPASKAFRAVKNGRNLVEKTVEPEDLPSLIGKEMTAKLLHPDNALDIGGGDTYHMLTGQDLKMGGQGMRGYYDSIVPKSVMKLAQQHDPDIKPAEPVPMKQGDDGYQGFHLPMTDKLRQGILNEGYPAMKRGGSVDAALAATRRFTKDGKGAILAQTGKEV